MEFLVPLHAADLELPKADRYHVRTVLTFEDETPEELSARVQRMEDRVLGSEAGLELLDEERLDATYSLVKKLPTLTEPLRMRIVEMLAAFVANVTEGVLARRPGSDAEDVALYRSTFKASVYFLVTALTSVSCLQLQSDKDIVKHKSRKKQQQTTINKINWTKVVEGAIQKLSRSVSPATFSMWAMNVPEEEFSMLYCKVVFELLGNASLCRGKLLKPKLYHLLAMSLQKAPAIHISVVASLIDLIYTHEHLSASIAELVELLYFKYANVTFAADLISEIGKISSRDASKDVAGTRNISMFLSSLSTLTPALIMGNLSFVLALLDSEAYQLRNAAVTCVTQILLWNFRQSGQQDPQASSADNALPKKKSRKHKKTDGESKSDGSDTDESTAEEDGSSSDSNDEDDAGLANTEAPRTFSRSTRDQLLTVLEDRTHDVNSFARGHVLKMWALLCEEGALPLHMLKNVTLMAVGRLQDKAAVVRRHSIHLLSLLLERNPFMGNLNREFYAKKRDELTEEMKKKRDEVIAGAEKEMSEALGEIAIHNGEDSGSLSPSEPTTISSEEQAAALEKELQTTVRLLKFYQDAIDFIDEFELQALPLMAQLLGSKSISDVLEAIQFFEKAYRFHLGAAQSGIKKILPLTWRSDVSIQEQLSNTFVSLFIRIDEDDPERNSPQLVAENLVKFLDECTVAEYTCLERIMGELHRNKKVPMVVVSSLWGLVDVTLYPISIVSNALVLLSMIASIDDSMLFSNDRLGQVLSMGFGDVACSPDSRFRVLGAACRLVQCIQLEPKNSVVRSSSQTQRRIQRSNLDATEQIILRLQRFLALDFVGDEGIELECLHSTWFDTVQQAIESIFSICERPEDVCGDVIKHLSLRLFESDTNDVSRVELAHFFFVLGHSAVKVAIHVEKLAAKVKKMRSNRNAVARPADNTASNGDAEDVTAMEDELGVAAEVEAEEDTFVNNVIQKEIACRNLLGMYGPLLIRVLVGKEEEFKGDELLTECAVVALSKFMAVSEEFCEKHLQLLFTILQDSPQPSVRGDVIIALGDLSFRFPNLVEPWTSHLYNRLRDVNLNVRKNTIVVLSHLILNDMIKVKGQISEIAISLVDENDGIRNLAKLFFFELSKKGNNPIYNMLPDAIGQLSTSELVSNADFQTIARFLIQFITKEKQIESIVEKLAQRFPTASKAQQQRDLAYCLARLPHTEKSLKYLYQNRKLFSDALHDDVVANSFTSLVAKARRGNSALSATAEMKEAVDTLDKFVVGMKEGKEEDEAMDGESTERASSPQAKGRPKRKTGGKAAKATRVTPKKRERAKRKVTRKKKATRVVSEDSSEEEE